MMANLFWPLVMLVVGLGLLVLELVIPSAGVLGILAGVTLLAAVASGFAFAGLAAGTLFMALTVVLIPLVLAVALRMWQSSALGRRLLMEPPDEAEVLPSGRLVAREWVGRKGVALSPMLPAGAVRIDDRYFDALTEGLSIEKDDPIVVVAIRDNRLVVRFDEHPLQEEATSSPVRFPGNAASPLGEPLSKGQPLAERSPKQSDEVRRPDVDLEVPDPFDDSLP